MEAPEAPRPRRCDRPGCALAATSLLSFDGGTGLVRIQRLHANPPPLTLVLCTTHTDRLVVPRGWVLNDERDEGHLFAAPGEGDTVPSAGAGTEGDPARVTPTAKPRTPRKRAAKAANAPGDEPGSEPGGEPADPPPPPPRPALFATLPMTPAPTAEPETVPDDPEALTNAPAERRLLHRAFRAASTREAPEPDTGP